jgi:hypothetical protein
VIRALPPLSVSLAWDVIKELFALMCKLAPLLDQLVNLITRQEKTKELMESSNVLMSVPKIQTVILGFFVILFTKFVTISLPEEVMDQIVINTVNQELFLPLMMVSVFLDGDRLVETLKF